MQVNQLKVVWVSHKHADHMMGLAGILHARHPSTPPLLVCISSVYGLCSSLCHQAADSTAAEGQAPVHAQHEQCALLEDGHCPFCVMLITPGMILTMILLARMNGYTHGCTGIGARISS